MTDQDDNGRDPNAGVQNVIDGIAGACNDLLVDVQRGSAKQRISPSITLLVLSTMAKSMYDATLDMELERILESAMNAGDLVPDDQKNPETVREKTLGMHQAAVDYVTRNYLVTTEATADMVVPGKGEVH